MKTISIIIVFSYFIHQLIFLLYNIRFDFPKKAIINCINLCGLAFITAFLGTV